MQEMNTIEVKDVYKSFKSYKDRAFQLKDAVVFGNFNKAEKREILKGISFNVKRGEAVALIGKNGCGKSTSLKLLTKILRPDRGTIDIVGRVSSLIELGAGFHPDMSGRENIYINASIFGLSKKEVDERLEDIIRFSEIEEYIDDPVRTYSSGMYMRLAFSIAINVDADVLLIDEILAVGDAAFQTKCFNKLKSLKANGATIVLVSHSMDQIKKLCDRVIWIEEGLIKEEGDTKEICENYMKAMEAARLERDRIEREMRGEKEATAGKLDIEYAEEYHDDANPDDKDASCRLITDQYYEKAKRAGTWDARYTKIVLCDKFGTPCDKFVSGDKIIIRLEYVNFEPDRKHSFYVGITRDDDVRANESSTKRECGQLLNVPKRGSVAYVIESNTLLAGKYTLGARIYGEDSKMCDDIEKLIHFEVFNANEHEAGMFSMKHRWIVNGEDITIGSDDNEEEKAEETQKKAVEAADNKEMERRQKRSMMTKRILAGVLAACLLGGSAFGGYFYGSKNQDQPSTENPTQVLQPSFDRNIVMGVQNKQFEVKGNLDDTLIEVVDTDYYSIYELNGFPPLERMDVNEANELVNNMQTMQKLNRLGISAKSFETPELNYKRIYTDVTQKLEARNYSNSYEFDGKTISELNEFLSDKENAYVKLVSEKVLWDETFMVKSNTAVDALGVTFEMSNELDKAIYALNVENFNIENFVLEEDKYMWGFFAVGCKNWSVKNSTFNNCLGKAMVILGEHEYIQISDCSIDNSTNGALLINGDIGNGIIKNNRITNTKGTTNFAAGMVLGSVEITDYTTGYNPYIDDPIKGHLEAPHNLVVMENYVYHSKSSGIYSDGSYCNYFINNTTYLNDKEGMCLDQGTVGCYVVGNTIKQNGGRRRQTLEEIQKDYVGEFGLMEDGSSPAKLPGISLDNAMYNIVSSNYITENYGSGVKMVRSCARNTIMNNVISENNIGQSDTFHFFGIELGFAIKPDFETTSIDFSACYENIIARNVITGEHYAGIFIAEECYINDFFDNIIMDSTWWSMECLSDRFNSTANNIADISSRGIDLSSATDGIYVAPAKVN